MQAFLKFQEKGKNIQFHIDLKSPYLFYLHWYRRRNRGRNICGIDDVIEDVIYME